MGDGGWGKEVGKGSGDPKMVLGSGFRPIVPSGSRPFVPRVTGIRSFAYLPPTLNFIGGLEQLTLIGVFQS